MLSADWNLFQLVPDSKSRRTVGYESALFAFTMSTTWCQWWLLTVALCQPLILCFDRSLS